MMSATASLGLILLWDVDGGLTQIDKVCVLFVITAVWMCFGSAACWPGGLEQNRCTPYLIPHIICRYYKGWL